MDGDTSKKETADSQQEASQVLVEIVAIKERAEIAATGAEQASAKANSESGFAFNAKQVAEAHATAISQVKGNVEADFAWLTTTKKNAEEVAQSIATAKGTSEADAQAIAKLKTTADQDGQLAAAARIAAETASAGVTKIQEDIASVQTRANEDGASVAAGKATIEAGALAVQALQAQVTEGAAKAQSDGAVIATREIESKNVLQSLTDVATSAAQAESRVRKYEQDLATLKNAFDTLHAKTEALLPGATSAGLASAFREQKSRFDKPQRNWLATFIVAVILLLAAGSIGLPTGNQQNNPSWDIILRHIVNRLPLVVPLVWLGIYAGRNYMLALRMQDEYAFKEVLSATFEGYKREMAGIQGPESTVAPLLTLCDNVLRTLAERPGRIYEGNHEDITPLAALAKAAREFAAKFTDNGGSAAKALDDVKK